MNGPPTYPALEPRVAARQLIARHHLQGRVDVARLRVAYGIDLAEADLSESVTVLLVRDHGWLIILNRLANRRPERSRFTIAHELGHYFLHRGIVPCAARVAGLSGALERQSCSCRRGMCSCQQSRGPSPPWRATSK